MNVPETKDGTIPDPVLAVANGIVTVVATVGAGILPDGSQKEIGPEPGEAGGRRTGSSIIT